MGNSKSNPPPVDPDFRSDPEHVCAELREKLVEGRQLLDSSNLRSEQEFEIFDERRKSWNGDVSGILLAEFTSPKYNDDFTRSLGAVFIALDRHWSHDAERAVSQHRRRVENLDGILKIIQRRAVQQSRINTTPNFPTRQVTASDFPQRQGTENSLPLRHATDHFPKRPATASEKSAVFIVHGHDTYLLNEVELFLRRHGLRPIVLSREANRGRSIPEKFEQVAGEASYALLLFSADDVGAAGKLDSHDELKARARQNVVLELGYFWKALGRENIAVLRDPEVEMPSDFQGVVFTPRNDNWQINIAKELEAAGYKINVRDI